MDTLIDADRQQYLERWIAFMDLRIVSTKALLSSVRWKLGTTPRNSEGATINRRTARGLLRWYEARRRQMLIELAGMTRGASLTPNPFIAPGRERHEA